MANASREPLDPVAFVQACVRARRMYWTHHVGMRLASRSIDRSQIISIVDSCEIIESDPRDKYLPSYLVLGTSSLGPLHVLFATGVEDDNVRIVTA